MNDHLPGLAYLGSAEARTRVPAPSERNRGQAKALLRLGSTVRNQIRRGMAPTRRWWVLNVHDLLEFFWAPLYHIACR